MIEAENVINSRPLTVENLSDHESPEPLTLNQLLTSKIEVVLPQPGCLNGWTYTQQGDGAVYNS